MFQNRSGQGGADGVMYRRAKLWQIIMVSTSAFIGMGFYSLIGLANYTASIGYGIATVAVGGTYGLVSRTTRRLSGTQCAERDLPFGGEFILGP